MSTRSRRALLVAVCMFGTLVYGAVSGGHTGGSALVEPLTSFPASIGPWGAQASLDLDAETLNQLGVDAYLNRTYWRDDDLAALYIGYYDSQRLGREIHSPMRCLPGMGWQPVRTGTIDVPIGGAAASDQSSVRVNRHIIQKGLTRQVVLFWYQIHGRVVASEYSRKFYLIVDSARSGRSDAALVRIISPIVDSEEHAEARAESRAAAFAAAVVPVLKERLPS